jgi:hypothetical protein
MADKPHAKIKVAKLERTGEGNIFKEKEIEIEGKTLKECKKLYDKIKKDIE